MFSRFICPHCHNSIDPVTLEVANSGKAPYRICPECDGPIALPERSDDIEEPLFSPSMDSLHADIAAESCIL